MKGNYVKTVVTGSGHMDFGDLERKIGYNFSDRSQLRLAVTHTSARQNRLADYERLEFLGDRVLGLIIAETLIDRFPKEKEGDLAKRLAQLVRKETLAKVAVELDLRELIRLSHGENVGGGRDNPSVLADVCEALIAALYLDGGLEAARRFVTTWWAKPIADLKAPPRDSKTSLQEWLQGRGFDLPDYVVTDQAGPAHEPLFTVEVRIEGLAPVWARGKSKRQAEQAAATEALDAIKNGGGARLIAAKKQRAVSHG